MNIRVGDLISLTSTIGPCTDSSFWWTVPKDLLLVTTVDPCGGIIACLTQKDGTIIKGSVDARDIKKIR